MIKIKTNPLHQWQLDVIRLYDEHPKDSIITIKSPRQRGKTYLLTILALREAINNNNRNVVIICPSYNIARKQYRDFTKAIKKLPNVLTMNKSYLEIEFCNFSIIKFKSAESGDNLRGETADLLIFDEGAFIDLETALECFNYTNTTNGNIVIASTPTFKDENNLFYKYYKAGIDNELNCYTIDFCNYDTTSMLSKDRMELYKKTMPYNIYCNEILGEFLTANSSVFGDFEHILRNNTLIDNQLTMGIDFANGSNNDETAISIFNSQKQQTHLFHFNDKNTTDTIKFIVNLLNELPIKRMVIEVNSIGKTFSDLLKQQISKYNIKTQVIQFTTTNKSKREIIETLQLNIQNGTISLLDDNQLKLQMINFEVKTTPTGLITYGNNSNEIHDDIVMSIALALYGFKCSSYVVR